MGKSMFENAIEATAHIPHHAGARGACRNSQGGFTGGTGVSRAVRVDSKNAAI